MIFTRPGLEDLPVRNLTLKPTGPLEGSTCLFPRARSTSSMLPRGPGRGDETKPPERVYLPQRPRGVPGFS